MTAPHSQPATTDGMLAQLIADHEKRIRKLERYLYAAAGAASGCTGTWLTIIMARR